MTLSERLEEWAHGYEAEGKAEGKVEGEGGLLRRQLTRL